MTRNSIREYAIVMRERYQIANRSVAAARYEPPQDALRAKGKGQILTEFCTTTSYHRKAAIRLLRHPLTATTTKRGRKPTYGSAVAQALKQVWEAMDGICSKRLAPRHGESPLATFLGEAVTVLERHGELHLEPELRKQLLKLSPATIDRLLKPYRPQNLRQPHTQGQSLAAIKAQVPVRTFGQWQMVATHLIRKVATMVAIEATMLSRRIGRWCAKWWAMIGIAAKPPTSSCSTSTG